MKITAQIAQHLTDVHDGDNWTDVNIEQTLADVSFEEAMMRTAASVNTIATLLHHISFWNRVVAERAAGKVPVIGADNGFAMDPLTSEEEWKALQEDNIRSADELAAAIHLFNEEKLALPILPEHSSAYKNFQGQVEHVHYHLGQMVMIKKMIRADN
jgi:glycosyltransferase involved in cell wall biosynthesis